MTSNLHQELGTAVRAVWIVIAILSSSPLVASAQAPFAQGVLLTDVATSRHSSRIAVRLADPLASAREERALRALLAQPCGFNWDRSRAVAEIARDLSSAIRVEVDIRSLEEIGLSPEAVFGKPALKRASRLTNQTSEQRSSWWKSDSSSLGSDVQTVGRKLFFLLDGLDLTLHCQKGQWVITTEESAEMNLQTRIYDVTPLSKVDEPKMGTVLNAGFYHQQRQFPPQHSRNLVHAIETHVRPDMWEALGGSSVITPLTVNDVRNLTISTTSVVHWEIEAFLNQLNQAEMDR